MANYIGNQIQRGEFKKLDSIESSFDGSTTTFNLVFNGTDVQVGDTTALVVSLNGVIQEPNEAYTLGNGGSQIVFSSAPAAGNTCFITQLGGIGDTATPSDGSVTTSKLAGDVVSDINDKLDSTTAASTYAPINNPNFTGEYIRIPTITTTARDALTPTAGYMIFNTTVGAMQQYDGSAWNTIAKPPIIASMSYSGSATAVDPAGGETITISGSNFETGVNVRFGTTYATSVTRTNSTSLSVVVPALTAGDYDIIVENGTGLQATLTNGLTSNAAPVWTTTSGSLGSIINDQAITTITLVATEDDAGAITYNVTTGALPTGLSLSGADIDGTPTGYTAETTANFTITATDDEGQTTDRLFSLTVLVGFYSYEIAQSLYFSDNNDDYMSRTMTTTGDRKTFTFSTWFKQGGPADAPGASNGYPRLIDFADPNNSNARFFISTQNAGEIGWQWYDGTDNYYQSGAEYYRDASSWYNLVWIVDTTESNAADRVKMYINNRRLTNFSGQNIMAQNFNTYANAASAVCRVGNGVHDGGYERNYDGYMAETYLIDGQALTPESFGQDKNGIWVPKEYTGTYGTNGFRLEYVNGAINQDTSGNGNHFTTSSNLGGANVTIDTPTNNFATINRPGYNAELRHGNVFMVGAGDACSSIAITDELPKAYCEVRIIQMNSNIHMGFTDALSNEVSHSDVDYWRMVYWQGGGFYSENTGLSSGNRPSILHGW